MTGCYWGLIHFTRLVFLAVSQIEEALEKVVALFTYINDKDVFGEIYRCVITRYGRCTTRYYRMYPVT